MITYDRLKELLCYSPKTGEFTWKVAASRRVKPGTVAGRESNGYIQIQLDGIRYYAHRLAWLHQYGKMPEQDIDHVNQKRADNRISNLREVNKSENMQNQSVKGRNTKSGLLGVSPHQGKFLARIVSKGIKHHIGCYDTAEEAHKAYLSAKQKLNSRKTSSAQQR